MTPFIVLATQRTGSTWVVDMLNSHPRVVAYSELFLDGASGRPAWGGAKDVEFWHSFSAPTDASASGPPAVTGYLDEVYRTRSGIDAVGVKIMYRQLGGFPDLQSELSRRRVRVVHLTRDPVDVVISAKAATTTSVFHSRDRLEHEPTMHVDVGWFLREMECVMARRQLGLRIVERLALEVFDVAYEDLLADEGAFAEILEWLGVASPASVLSSSLQQVIRAPRERVIENYEELQGALASSPLGQQIP